MTLQILLVNDQQKGLDALLCLCRGYDNDIAKSGEEAVRMVVQKKYDLVFMDYLMPGINGLEAIRKIREISQVPIFMYSTYPLEERELKEARCNGYFNSDNILDAVKMLKEANSQKVENPE